MISKKSVELVANDAESKVYDNDPSTDPELTFEDYTDQLIESDVETVSAAVEITRDEGQDAGEYDIYFNIDDLNKSFTNYDFSGYLTGGTRGQNAPLTTTLRPLWM